MPILLDKFIILANSRKVKRKISCLRIFVQAHKLTGELLFKITKAAPKGGRKEIIWKKLRITLIVLILPTFIFARTFRKALILWFTWIRETAIRLPGIVVIIGYAVAIIVS